MNTTKKNNDTVLVLRTCRADMTSRNGFVWPNSGPVKCDDWDATPQCGGGLHGLLWGEGDGTQLNWMRNTRWIVVRVPADSIIPISSGKVKFPAGEVVHCGTRASATEYLMAHGGAGRAIAGGTSTSGNYGTSTSGDSGTSTSGDYGTSTSGYRGTSTSGDSGTSTSGDSGTSTSGDYGTSTSGDSGTSTSGNYGTAMSGDGGILELRYWDAKAKRYRVVVGYVGEDGLEPNVPYRLDDQHKLVEI